VDEILERKDVPAVEAFRKSVILDFGFIRQKGLEENFEDGHTRSILAFNGIV